MRGGILKGCDYEDFLYIQQVGVVAPFMLSKLFKDHFCGVGSIVNISSTRAFQSQPNTESYSAAKRRHHRFDARYGCEPLGCSTCECHCPGVD